MSEIITRELTGAPRCEHCDAPKIVTLEVWATGFSCGSTHQHKSGCLATLCEHGQPDPADCEQCAAMEPEEDDCW